MNINESENLLYRDTKHTLTRNIYLHFCDDFEGLHEPHLYMVSNAIENAILETSKEYYMQRENVYPFVIFSDSEGKRFIVSFIFDKKNSKLVRLIIDRLFKAEITLNGFVGAIYDWDEHRQRDINVKGRNMARFYTVHKDLINNFNWIDLMCYAPFFHKEDVQKRIIKEQRKAFKKMLFLKNHLLNLIRH